MNDFSTRIQPVKWLLSEGSFGSAFFFSEPDVLVVAVTLI